MSESRPPVAVILAGGRSSRLGGQPKALAPLAGRRMIEFVIERLRPQVGRILLSVQQEETELAGLGDGLVVDVVQRFRGPLTGLCSAMLQLSERDWDRGLLLTACDAPFLPGDLAPRLASATREGTSVCVARYRGVVQPVFSLWRRPALEAVGDAVLGAGQGGLMRVLDGLPHTIVDWTERDPDPFFNVNTPEDLEQAARWIDATEREP